jgi:NhaP-type Na+/H+ and K+/H+ antiporter
LTNLDVLRAYNVRLQERLVEAADQSGQETRLPDARAPERALARLRGYRVVELELSTGHAPVGRRLGEVAWPEGTTVLGLRRGERAIDPESVERLQRGDCVSLLVPAAAADSLAQTIGEPDEEAPHAAAGA